MGNENVSTKDLYDLIQKLAKSNDEIKTQIKETKDEIKTEIKVEVKSVREDLLAELQLVRKENESLKEEVESLKTKLEKLEKNTKKYNLIFYGLNEKENQTKDFEDYIKLINTKAKTNCQSSDIRNFYRLGKPQADLNRPVSVEFCSYFLKQEILSKADVLKANNVIVSLEYTEKEYKDRKFLRENLKTARNLNLAAQIKNSKLKINEEEFTIRDLKEKPSLIADIAEELQKSEKQHQKRDTKRKAEEEVELPKENPTKKILRNRNIDVTGERK